MAGAGCRPVGERQRIREASGGPDFAEARDVAEALDPRQILAEMQRLMRLRHWARRTERSYVRWVHRFLE